MRTWAGVFALLLCTLLCSCKAGGMAEKSFYALDTLITISAPDDMAIGRIEELIKRYEALLSVTDEGSDIYKLNSGYIGEVAAETVEVVQSALKAARETEGLYDPTIHPIVSAWGFTKGANRVPTQEEIDGLLPLVDYRNVTADGDTIDIPKDCSLDLGGVAKGYITDAAVKELRALGVSEALLNLGGNVYAVGSKKGKPWRVGISNPFDGGLAGTVSVCDTAVITSGDYQRFFESGGKVYHHIFDPKTGYPADSDLKSVTIISADAAMADGYSTALFVMGHDKAVEFWKSSGKAFGMVLIKRDKSIYVTEGVAFESDADPQVIN